MRLLLMSDIISILHLEGFRFHAGELAHPLIMVRTFQSEPLAEWKGPPRLNLLHQVAVSHSLCVIMNTL